MFLVFHRADMSLKLPKKLYILGMVAFVNAAVALQIWNMIILHPIHAVVEAMCPIYSCYAYNAIEASRIVVRVKYIIGR